METRNLKVVLAYDGTDFCGWQMQHGVRTVQGEVESALKRLHGHPIRVRAAGRTDSGVHARGQVISFESGSSIPTEAFTRALNSRLPRDVRAISSCEVPTGFHARYSARRRDYHYYIENGDYSDPFSRRYCLTVKQCPPIELLNACAGRLVGTHDFSTFCAAGDQSKSKTRRIFSASFLRHDRFVAFRISGNAFLWRMVRSIVGTILETCGEYHSIDSRDRCAESFAERIASKERHRAGSTAPAKGLFLTRVWYDE